MTETKNTPAPKATAGSSSDNTTLSVLSWIFAPIVGIFFLSHEDEDVKWHAKQSMYFGLVSIAVYVLGFVCITVLSVITFFLGSILYCVLLLWVFVDFPVRIYAAIKASQGERWEVPVISGLVK